jgi:two-component system, OmpR family, sensor histidine kinase BaeS
VSGFRPLAMRMQLAAAMVALAALSVAVAGLLIHRGADREVADFGRRDLQQTANRIALTAAFGYAETGRWVPRRLEQIVAAETAEDHVVVLLDANGRSLAASAGTPAPDSRRALIMRGRERVGTVIVGHPGGGFLQVGRGRTERRLDAHLTSELDQRLLESAVVAGGCALLLGLLVAFRVTAPLERVTAVARRMAHGEIETRASGGGGNRETRELAATLDRLAAALRRQDELRRATGADVAHELNNALVGIVGRLEALQDGVMPDPDAAIERTLRDAQRLHQLVDDVRLLADAQRPSLLVRKQLVDLDEIAAERVAAYVDDFREQGIELRCELAPVVIEADPERLVQVIDNLLSNALRYTDPGGRVDVTLEVRRGDAVLHVADTGIGIAPELLGRVFDRFWRAPEARERTLGGSGVGLALVRDLVLAHNGRVEVASRPGKGSTFSVWLPRTVGPAVGSGLPQEGGTTVVGASSHADPDATPAA